MALLTQVESRKARRKEERHAKKKRKLHSLPTEANTGSVETARPPTSESEITTKRPRHQTRKQDEEDEIKDLDPYADLDPSTVAALQAEDAEIAELEAKLGLTNQKEKSKLHREYAQLEGYGDDFGDFLDELDTLTSRLSKPPTKKGKIVDQSHSASSDLAAPSKNIAKQTKIDPYSHLDPSMAAALRSDDAEIAQLEAKLGLGNPKDRQRLHREYAKLEGYGHDFGEFLDDLDNIVDRLETSSNDDNESDGGSIFSEGEYPTSDEGEDDDQEEEVPMKEPFEHLDEDDSVLDEIDASELKEDGQNDSDGTGEKDGVDESDDEDDDMLSGQADPDHDVHDTYRPTQGEDIYGKKLDGPKTNDPITKYVPPHLRKNNEDDQDPDRKESLQSLQRALNNALNRLSQDTLISVAQSIAKLYPSYPTPDVNEGVWNNLVTACVDRPLLMSGMIPVYVACLTAVHMQTGDNVQLGGYLIEQVIHKLWLELKSTRSKVSSDASTCDNARDGDNENISKVASNLILVLCYLYNFTVLHCAFIYDVIRNLLEHISELDVELLLLILSHCGHALRSDDPTALKEIVMSVQERVLLQAKNSNGASTTSRVEYMVSAMMDLKNNKKRKQDMAFGEITSKLRKLLGRVKSTVAASGAGRSSDSCLRITLDDILAASTKGRWWKVGASWAGNQYKHRTDDDNSSQGEGDGQSTPTLDKTNSTKQEDEEALLKLASKYRMNTDIRRSIFCIIMGSADCDDSFEKLVRAGMLKSRTERDTVRVLTECCGNETTYNPFYSHLAARICEYQPQCKFTFQLAYWDTFKQFDAVNLRKAANLAKLLCDLVATHRTLRMSILKVIDMAPDTMHETAMIFLTIFFSNILETFEDPAEVFQLFTNGMPSRRRRGEESTSGRDTLADNADDGADGEGLRASLSVFFLQTLKSSPKNMKNSKFRANFKAAVKACETDELDSMLPS